MFAAKALGLNVTFAPAGCGGWRALTTSDRHDPRSPWIQGLRARERIGSLSSTS